MLNDSQKKLTDAVFVALKPIVRTLLRTGIGYREFNEIAKAAFVDIGSSDFGLRSRPTNLSRVAAMTGISRREVKRFRESQSATSVKYLTKPIAPRRALIEWHSNPRFLESDGSPKALMFSETGAEPSFSELVKTVGSDVPPGAMRTELKRLGCIDELDDGSLVVVKAFFLRSDLNDRLSFSLSTTLRVHAETILHNTDPQNQNDLWPEKIVYTTRMREGDLPRFKRTVTRRLDELAQAISDLVDSYEQMNPEDQPESANSGEAVGIGLYFFRDTQV